MRLVDMILRRGHLSERALVEVCTSGERPAHLDHCGLCADRAVDLGRWLDGIRAEASAEADAAFPAERLAAQQTQILRRLEQLDHPARVIAFPGHARYGRLDGASSGIRPAWVGIAAAAGLVLGVFGGHYTARLGTERAATPARSVETASYEAPQALLDLDDSDQPLVPAFEALDRLTPTVSGQNLSDRRQAGFLTVSLHRNGAQ